MRFRIDVIKDSQQAGIEQNWKAIVAERAARPGFSEAQLHRVYKRLNADGYAYVSIEKWTTPEAGGQIQPGSGDLYDIVNQGHKADQVSEPGNVIVSNPYRISPEEAGRYAEMWDASKRHMETREGFVSAYLFQAVDKTSEYFFVSRAEWRSEEAFMQNFDGKDFKQIIAPFEGIFSICLSRVVETVGSTQ